MTFSSTLLGLLIVGAQQASPPLTPTGPARQSPVATTPQTPPTADSTDKHPPAVSGGTPTITDAATLSAPGWIEFDPGVLKDIDRDSLLGTPLTLKYTALNNRLQYLLGSDGYVEPGGHVQGVGDTYPGIHYLFLTQEKYGFDVAGKGILKVPTAHQDIGGTGRYDYSAYALASRDFTKWGFHGDFNLGVESLSRDGAAGYDTQTLVCGSTTSPFTGGRWQYTNELAYFSPIAGQESRLTMIHGFSYAVHSYLTCSAALQVALHGDIARYQILFAASFNIGHF